MNTLLTKLSISFLLMISAASVSAGPGRNWEGGYGYERQRVNERIEYQGERRPNPERTRRFEGNTAADTYNNRPTVRRDNPGNGYDEPRRHGKLTPEERKALRQQINEAGQDIYIPKR